ncbi:MAG TPA: DUF1772 domain-containing protein [Bryobacteraceae bacterium]|nr:DUF1772 domain-containing protein [Bryobacteraceae bacterium]
MSTIAAARFGSVFSAGLVAGVLLGDRMGASFARPALSASSFVTFQQILHRHFVWMMPILLGIAILSMATWLMLAHARPGSAEFTFVGLAELAFISIVVLTRAINVPINVQLMTWDASSPPSGVMNTWVRWEQAHTARTVIAVLGFALLLLAFGTSRSQQAA